MVAYYSFFGLILQGLIVNILFATSSTEGQNLREVKVTMSSSNIKLGEAFKIIEKNTNFRFLYNDQDIPVNEKTEFDFDNESLYSVLEKLAKEFGLSFSRVDNQIVVKKNIILEETPVAAIENGTIIGKVTDERTGEELIGASVSLKGTTKGTYTNKNGYYEINDVKPGKYTIAVSYIGYSTTTKAIEVKSGKATEINLTLGQSALNLDEVIVTGSISERSIRESANPITVISPKDLENRNLTSLSSVLETVPGIVISSYNDLMSSQGGRVGDLTMSYLNIRGYSPTSGGSSPIKVILDGVELANIYMLNFLDPNQIEKIEIARGPMSSTLYGAGSSGGIIQVFTKRGLGNLKVNLKTLFTSQESKYQDANPLNSEYSLRVNGSKGDWGYNFGINYALVPNSRWKTNNGIDQKNWSFSAGVSGKIDNIGIDLRIQRTSTSAGSALYDRFYWIALEQGWANSASLKSNLSDQRIFDKGIVTSLNLKHTLNDNLHHNMSVSYSQRIYDQHYFTPGTASDGTSTYYTYTSIYTMVNAKYYMNWKQPVSDDFKFDLTGGFDLSGGEISYADDRYTQAYSDNVTLIGNLKSTAAIASNTTNSTTAFFTEGVWGYKDKLFLTTGYRAEKNNSYGEDLGWFSIPRIGLTYVMELGDFTFKPRISWGKSTQPPSPLYKTYDISVQSGITLIRLANPDLKPQSQSGYELGTDVFFTSHFSFGVTYYSQKITDLIQMLTQSIVGTTYSYQYVNIREALNKGVEISAKAIYNPFTLDISYTHLTSKYGSGFPAVSTTTDPEYHDGGRILGIPSGSFVARLTYSVPALLSWSQKGGNLSLEYVYKGDEYNQDYVAYNKTKTETGKYVYTYREFPGYYRVNVRGDYSVLNNLTLFFDVKNLLNNQDLHWYGPFAGRNISFGFNVMY